MPTIANCAIHPAIGIARIGNSRVGMFIGPEIPGIPAGPPDGFKDANTANDSIKRQAARFRVYGFGKDKKCLGEITPAIGKIEWSVEIANAKSEWDQFDGRAGEELPLNDRRTRAEWRNNDLEGEARRKLIISPTPVVLSGPLQRAVFVDGKFFDTPVILGEARTDAEGRLIILGGYGLSGTTEEGRQIVNYANNDRWYDDIADGPVLARVTLKDGRVLIAKPSWIITAPPDFSPETPNVVTLFDVALDTAIYAGWLKPPKRPSFTEHIYPLLQRAIAATWTTARPLKPHRRSPLLDLARLSDPGSEGKKARHKIFKVIRSPFATGDVAVAQANEKFMPALAGDDGDCEDGVPGTWLTVTKTQYRMLEQWAAGDFDGDWKGAPLPPCGITPAGIDRAALEACAGGAFYPGIEGGWIFRKQEAYAEPFRFNARKLKPGDVTKRMAVPWQADFFECNTWWWPAQRPDDVIPMHAYHRLQQIDRELANPNLGTTGPDKVVRDELLREREELVLRRVPWARDLPASSPEGDNAMVREWPMLGFISSSTPAGERVTVDGQMILVETEKALSPKADLAEAFFRLVNIERYPEFRPLAKQLGVHFLRQADYSIENYRPFEYTVETFRERLDKIYNEYVADIDTPHWLEAYPRSAVVENLRQKAPLNLTDGAWLHHILSAGPTDDVKAKLFSIWTDEAGNGQTELNHSNVYDTLLRTLDVYLPPISSRAFKELDLLPSAWENPVFQMGMGLFPEEFFPELLGMTLYLEWEATPTMLPIVRMLRKHNIDPQFYAMHAAIDNVTSGHGAFAREAVELHLDKIRAEGGYTAVQREWRRIWNGYVTWATLGTFGSDLGAYIDKYFGEDHGRKHARERMLDIVRRKAPYARTVHGTVRLGGQLLGSLFARPETLLDMLHEHGWIDPENPRDSRFVTELLGFHGPMYKVFSKEEKDTLLDWISSLSDTTRPVPIPVGAAQRVRLTIDNLLDRAAREREHEKHKLLGIDGRPLSVAELFKTGDPDRIMAALAGSEYIVKGDPDGSRLINEVFNDLMVGILDDSEVEAFKEWIRLGCPPAQALLVETTRLNALTIKFRDEGLEPPELTQAPFARRRHFIGAGAVH